MYSLSKHDVHEVLVYIAITMRLNDFVSNYARTPTTYHLYQKIMFIKINLLLGDYDLHNVLPCIKENIKLSFKEFFLMYIESPESKTQKLTSTVKLINKLMSKDFKPLLMKINKIEINNISQDTILQIQSYTKELNRKKESKEDHLLLNNLECNQSNHPHSVSSKPISLRYSPNIVKKFKIDGKIFKKSYNKKKDYLEKYSQKELTFHKNMLYMKKYESEASPLQFSVSQIKNGVEDFFSSNEKGSTLHHPKNKKLSESLSLFKMNKSASYNLIFEKLKHPNLFRVNSFILEYDQISKLSDNKIYNNREANEHNKTVLKKIAHEYDKINYLKKHLETNRSKLTIN